MSLLTRYPEVNQRFQERLQLYRDATEIAYSAVFEPFNFAEPEEVNSLSDAATRAGLHSLVADGVVEGTEVLVIDLDKCIHCNECEEACERRHGHSRMNRKGMVVGNISIATACRQCQDPVCMLCSRAGIARMPGGEVYITESCIGCGICAERCPYDNISIISLDDDDNLTAMTRITSTWQQFSTFFTKGAGKERGQKLLPMAAAPGPLNIQRPSGAFEEMRKKLAIKCDLCAGYDNQACVQACPYRSSNSRESRYIFRLNRRNSSPTCQIEEEIESMSLVVKRPSVQPSDERPIRRIWRTPACQDKMVLAGWQHSVLWCHLYLVLPGQQGTR